MSEQLDQPVSRGRPSECPACGASIPVDSWPAWCAACSWGIAAPPEQPPRTRIDALYQRAGRRAGSRLMTRLASAHDLRPRLTATRVAAGTIALGVHLLTLGLAVGGAALILLARTNVFGLVGGVIMLLSAWLMRPRLGSAPEGTPVTRATAPELHRLLDDVAGSLRVKPPDIVVVTHEWNASFAVVGLRRRHVLTLGLPLVTALSPAERVALVAHELAHGRNGDSRRGLFVGSAVQALVELYELLAPSGGETALDVLHAAVFWPLSRPILWLLHLESHLLLHDAQRAEYLADALAAEVAGTDAVVALSESLLLAPSFFAIVSRNVHGARRGDARIFTELDDMVGRIDSRERDRRRRIARLESSRLDATHPPTALRIELLEQRPRLSASVRLSLDASAAIDAELGDNRPRLADTLIDEQRDRIYY